MINLNNEKTVSIHVVISSSLLIVVLIAWVSFMALNPLLGTHSDQLRNLAEQWQNFRLNFAIALTIAPVFLYFMVSLHQLVSPSVSITKITGYTIAMFYVVAATFSYGAQLTLVPYYLNQDAIFMAELWYFFNPDSLAYFINQTGYAFWAVAVLVLFWSLFKREGIERWLGALFILSAITSLMAYAGLLAGVPALSFLTLISGVLTLPIAILALVLAIKRLRKINAAVDPEAAINNENIEKNDEDDIPLTTTTETVSQPMEKETKSEDVDLNEPMNTDGVNSNKGNTKKRIIMVLLGTILVFAGVLGGFIGVVSFMNPIPEDVELLEVYNPQVQELPLNVPVTITTFNIGYGGLDKDRDFFMDGGVESRSESLERTLENSREIISFLQASQPNIMLLQEVDIRSSRSFDVNQLKMFQEAFPHHASVHGWNYKALWVPVPVFNPMGYADSGITTFGEYAIENPVRYQLPGSEAWPRQLFDLDRCMIETKIPVDNGKTLVLVNLHLSAYDKGGRVREHQIGFVKQYLTDQVLEGHYVIVGGDWNHLLAPHHMDDPAFMANWPDWLMPLPDDFTPENYDWAVDTNVFTVRDNATPYRKGESFVTVIDGFIVSNNVEVHRVEGHDLDFTYSDHNPVSLVFSLQ